MSIKAYENIYKTMCEKVESSNNLGLVGVQRYVWASYVKIHSWLLCT